MRTCSAEAARAAASEAFGSIERDEARRAYVPPTPEQAAQSAAMLKAVRIGLWRTSTLAAKRWGAEWEMDAEESEAIAQPLVQIVERWTGRVPDNPYTALALAVGMYAVPRVLQRVFGVDVKAAVAAMEPPANEESTSEPREVQHEVVQTEPAA